MTTATFETRMTVPTADLARVMDTLARRGCLVLDAGERTATDDGDDAEATIHVLFVDAPAIVPPVSAVQR